MLGDLATNTNFKSLSQIPL